MENLKNISVTTENEAQFRAALECGKAGLIYMDAAFAAPEDYARLLESAHQAKVLCGLRLPQIWREEAERFFTENLDTLKQAGFDCWLFRNMEGLLWFYEHGLLESTSYVLDHGIYVTNTLAVQEILSMLPDGGKNLRFFTCSLELNSAELRDLIRDSKEVLKRNKLKRDGSESGRPGFELTVYGRAPMMVSAQCLKRTARGCDHQESTLYLRDRKEASMPVKNSCRFCLNTIYNAVPAMLYDQPQELEKTGADSFRYEFTTESPEEVKKVLGGTPLSPGSFTRGHFKKSVQ